VPQRSDGFIGRGGRISLQFNPNFFALGDQKNVH